jgi:predicted metalloprotease with PDZ domain
VSPLFPKLSAAEASANKGASRFAVYDGGWSLAFCLDARIRAVSDSKRSLDDAMRALHE